MVSLFNLHRNNRRLLSVTEDSIVRNPDTVPDHQRSKSHNIAMSHGNFRILDFGFWGELNRGAGRIQSDAFCAS
jgi:hypothetical protein